MRLCCRHANPSHLPRTQGCAGSRLKNSQKSTELSSEIMKASIVISTVVLASLTPLTWAEERGVFEGALARAKLVKSTGPDHDWDATGTKGNSLVTGPLYANAQKDSANELVRPGGAAELRSQSELLVAPTKERVSHEVVRPGGAGSGGRKASCLPRRPGSGFLTR